MRLPTYSQAGFGPFLFENWDNVLVCDPARKQKFQTFCEQYMDRVRKGESNSEEIDRFATLLKGEQPGYFRLARGVIPEFKFGTVITPCNQDVERIVCSLHDLIVRPSQERTLAVGQAAADKQALANVMFGRGTDWTSSKRMTRLLESTMQLGFPATAGASRAGYPTLRDALGLRADGELQGSGVLESGPSSAVDECSTATSSQECYYYTTAR